MKDFSIEELQLIKNCISYAYGNADGQTQNILETLYVKVKDMIDNYSQQDNEE